MKEHAIALNKLEQLIKEALTASTEIEKAAIYGAVHALLTDIEKIKDDGYLCEKAEGLRWHIGAIIGYDITNDHDQRQHAIWARSDLESLKNSFAERKV